MESHKTKVNRERLERIIKLEAPQELITAQRNLVNRLKALDEYRYQLPKMYHEKMINDNLKISFLDITTDDDVKKYNLPIGILWRQEQDELSRRDELYLNKKPQNTYIHFPKETDIVKIYSTEFPRINFIERDAKNRASTLLWINNFNIREPLYKVSIGRSNKLEITTYIDLNELANANIKTETVLNIILNRIDDLRVITYRFYGELMYFVVENAEYMQNLISKENQ